MAWIRTAGADPIFKLVLAKLLPTASNLFRRGSRSHPSVLTDTEEEGLEWIAERRRPIAAA